MSKIQRKIMEIEADAKNKTLDSRGSCFSSPATNEYYAL
jgi:hypothetical protein